MFLFRDMWQQDSFDIQRNSKKEDINRTWHCLCKAHSLHKLILFNNKAGKTFQSRLFSFSLIEVN